MSKNTWDLNLDIKFRYSAEIPIFRRKDSAVLNIHIFDAKEKKDISNFKKATLSIKYPSGIVKELPCERKGSGIDTYVSYQFTDDAMLEIGVYDLIVRVEKDDGFISTPKFHITFFDNVTNSEYEFVKLMQDLQLKIDYLNSVLGLVVTKDKIDVPNGVAPLDSLGRVPMANMPLFLENHINENLYLHKVHGFMVDSDMKLVYETKDGGWEYIGHPDNSGMGTRLNLMSTVAKSIVDLYYSGRGHAVEQRWLEGNMSISDMKLKGTLFTGLSFTVSNIGMHTIYYKDNSGNEYLHKFNVALDQLKDANITVSVDNGKLKVDSDVPVDVWKFAKGRQTIDWFRTNGTILTATTNEIKEVGEYSVYCKDKFGRESVRYITVTVDMLNNVDIEPPVITLTETPSGWTNGDKKVAINITDNVGVEDRRYVLDANKRYTAKDFLDNINLGTKMTSNTLEITVKDASWLTVFAMDKAGNNTVNVGTIYKIDRDAPEIEVYDLWNPDKQKYEIHFKVVDYGSGIKELKLPDGSKYNQSYEGIPIIEDIYETTIFGKMSFTILDVVGNSKTYSYNMKGKVIDVTISNNVTFIIREDGFAYGMGVNESGQLGIGKITPVAQKFNKFQKVLIPNKVVKVIQSSGGISLFLDNSGNMWETGYLAGMAYYNERKSTEIISTPRIHTAAKNVTDVYLTLQNGFAAAILSEGKWLFTGGGFGESGNGTTTTYSNWTQVGQKSPQVFNKYKLLDSRGFYFGTNNKLYASGHNANSSLGIAYNGGYTIVDPPQESILLSSYGKIVDMSEVKTGNGTLFIAENGKVVEFNAAQVNVAKEYTGIPAVTSIQGMFVFYSFSIGTSLIAVNNALYFNGENKNGIFGDGTTNNSPTNGYVKMPWANAINKVSGQYGGIMFIDSKGGFYENSMNDNYLYPQSANEYLMEYEKLN